MVHHDMVGAARQEQIVQYIQHIRPTDNQWGEEEGGGGGG